MNSMQRQKDRTLRDELPRLVGTQYTTAEEWRNSSRKNEEAERKEKKKAQLMMLLVMKVKSDAVKNNIA